MGRLPAMNEGNRHSLWAILLSAPLGLLAAWAARSAVLLPVRIDDVLERYPECQAAFHVGAIAGFAALLAAVLKAVAVLFVTVSIIGVLVRSPWVTRLLRKTYLVAYLAFWLVAQGVFRATGLLQQYNVRVGGSVPDSIDLFYWRAALLWPIAAAAVGVAWLYMTAWRRRTLEAFGEPFRGPQAPGDRILEDIRTHGPDPVFRKSVYSSIGLHVLVIVVLPWLLSSGGCVEDYRIQKGSGTPQVAVVKMVKAEKKKKKKYLLNPQSAIIFKPPDLDDSPLLKQVDEQTQMTYRADPTRVLGTGKLGAGGGKTGGWPDGSENAKFRFIRLEYNGPGWDDGMDAVSRADRNFLDEFRKVTGFKTAESSESHPIANLRRYRKGFAPPFVYMTGHGDINASASDAKILREYLLEGGMLFADCGSPRWDQNFRAFMQAVFPGEPLRVIADDDPLFQFPYIFANGAPPLWHHGGMRAMGIKNRGRWVVFYHPGDINDAWKTGHSGMDSSLTKGAFEMGVNIVYYSFTHYLEMTRKYRK